MSKKQLAEFAILAVAIIFAFKAFESTLAMIIYFLYYFSYDMGGNSSGFINSAVVIIAYVAGFFILVKKRSHIVNYMTEKEHGEILPIKANLQELLYIVFIAISLITMFSTGSKLISYAINYFQREVSSGIKEEAPEYLAFKEYSIEFIVAFLVLYFARPLSNYFTKKNEMPLLEFEKKDDPA